MPIKRHGVIWELRRRWWSAYRILWNIFIWLPKGLWAGRFRFAKANYTSGMSISDTFFGIRLREKRTLSRYGVFGFSLDDSWYQPTTSYGFVFFGRWYGMFVDGVNFKEVQAAVQAANDEWARKRKHGKNNLT